jgi:hypothetical protein
MSHLFILISTLEILVINLVPYVVLCGCAIAEVVSHWLPTVAVWVCTWVWQVEFVVDKVPSGQVLSEYFGFSCHNPFIPPTSPSSQSPGVVSRGLAMS